MWNLLKSELLKLRRCQILLVGLVALALCPLVQYGSQLIVEAEYRNPNYDFSALFENVVWGNTQIFLPISLVMIGGWLIDRESTHDTLKNIMTIPVSMPKMLGAKLLLVGMLAVLLGIYSVGITLITGLTVGLLGRSEGHIWAVPFWRSSLDTACCFSKVVSLPASIRSLLR